MESSVFGTYALHLLSALRLCTQAKRYVLNGPAFFQKRTVGTKEFLHRSLAVAQIAVCQLLRWSFNDLFI